MKPCVVRNGGGKYCMWSCYLRFHTAWNKGKPQSEEQREMTRQWMKEHPLNYWLGKKRSEETKRKISETKKGTTPWNKGKEFSFMHIFNLSKSHMGQKRGELNNRWKGGITSVRNNIRGCGLYKQWIRNVFHRDNHTCQLCGSRGGMELHAHHIKPFGLILEENNITTFKEAELCSELWDITNGQTLCFDCHYGMTWE